MLNINKISAIAVCSVLTISSVASVPAYAESTGNINISATVKSEGFKGEIYVILTDKTGKQKLALLTPDNNYQSKIDGLQYGNYEIKEIHVFNTANESDKNRESMTADYTLDYDSLNLNDKNKNASVMVDIHSLKTKNTESDNKNDKNNSKTTTTTDNKNDNNTDENKSDNNTNIKPNDNTKLNDKDNKDNKEDNQSIERRKNFIFWNFIIDAILIITLGSVWFFKVRVKKKGDK